MVNYLVRTVTGKQKEDDVQNGWKQETASGKIN